MAAEPSLSRRIRETCLAARIERERALFQRYRARRVRRKAEETYDRILTRLVREVLALPVAPEPRDGAPDLRLIRGGRAS